MCDNKTVNFNNKTLTVNHNIDFLYLNLTYYPELSYKSNIESIIKSKIFIKKYKVSNLLSLLSNWNIFIKYWNDTITDYSKAFDIKFDNLKLNTDYSLVPIYITENILYIGIILLNYKQINTNTNINSQSYSFLSEIKLYQCKNKLNMNKYNFINGILNKKINKNNVFVLDTQKKIPLHYILQNSLNYIPNLEIIRVKKNLRNPLNP